MTKKYLMRRTIETEIVFEGTEEEIRDQYCGYINGYKTLDGDEVKVELLDDVDQYMEQMNVRWCSSDLETLFYCKGKEFTEENVNKFMEANWELSTDTEIESGWDSLEYYFDKAFGKEI